MTRTPDAHWMAEVRYRGTKVVTVSPDYADNTKFADEWLPAQAGTDAALAMAMGHVMLKEFFVEREVPFFSDYVRQYTDLPFLVRLERRDDGTLTPSKFVTAKDIPAESLAEDAAFRTVLFDKKTGRPAVPNGSLGSAIPAAARANGTWTLRESTPHCPCARCPVTARRSCCRASRTPAAKECAPARRSRHRGGRAVGHHVFDLMLAQYGVGRDGLPGEWAAGYDDAGTPYTPAWQEEITSVPAQACIRVAREFARNAEESKGRSMIIMGAGICQWFHGDATYRAVLALVMLTGCMGRNGGGWAHYVARKRPGPPPAGCPWRTRWTGHAAADHDRHRLLVHAHGSVAAGRVLSRRPEVPAVHRGPGRHAHCGRHGPVRPAGLDAVLPAVRPQPVGCRG